jgi:hypothetical protein
MNNKTNGQIAYEAYWKSFTSGKAFLPWAEICPAIKAAWEQTAAALYIKALEDLKTTTKQATGPGAALIVAERQRQLLEEDYGPEHDDQHVNGELLSAGMAYLLHAVMSTFVNFPPPFWPWEKKWWKPGPDAERNLVKGCALIAAEIDRRRRANGTEGTKEPKGPMGPDGAPGVEEARQTGRSALPGN